MNHLILTAALMLSQESPEEVRARIAIAVAVQQLDKAPTFQETYHVAMARAASAGKPIVVSAGCDAPQGAWLTARVPEIKHLYGEPGMVLAVPHKYSDGSTAMAWVKQFPPGTSLVEIVVELERWGREVRASQPAPFQEPSAAPRQEPSTADADNASLGRWEWTSADIPEYMERYDRASNTQRISVTNGSDLILPVSRRSLEAKWQVPGGMEGLRGWSSALYKWAPHGRGVGNIAVWNGSNFQNNRGWKRSYDDGTEFLDVLTNTDTGKVFEVRKALKHEGSWQRFVTYRNQKHWPAGYHGPSKLNCHSCHNEAGTGGYAVGLVPGGDTVLSDPFPALEGSR